MWLKYGYFVRLPNGIVIRSGDSYAQSPDTRKAGDSLGVKNGKEGVVLGVVKGEPATRNGFDVMVLVEEREPPGQFVRRVTPPEVVEEALRVLAAAPTQPQAPPTVQTEWKTQNKRAVAIWNKLNLRPFTETFHEFLIEVPLKGSFGEAWYQQELAKPSHERHIVEQWLRAFREEAVRNRPIDHKSGQVYGGPATGATTELISLAHDLYMLQKVNHLPDRLVERLRNYNEFQGARYEVAIAAAFVKCGFEVEWLENRIGKHPEFWARHTKIGEELAVETKSRRRPGALHQTGTLPAAEQLRADVDRLYKEALEQDPGNCPFAVFLNVNLPPNATDIEAAEWQREIVNGWQNDQQQLALLGFTNFSWHYLGDERTGGRPPEFILAVPAVSVRPLRTQETVPWLVEVLNHYGLVPNEY